MYFFGKSCGGYKKEKTLFGLLSLPPGTGLEPETSA